MPGARRRQIRSKLIVTFIALVTMLVVSSAYVWYRVATGHVRREMENRLLAVAEAGGLVFDPELTTVLVGDLGPRTRAIAQDQLRQIKDRLGVREAYIFDRQHRILASTDSLGMDVGVVSPQLGNYAAEIDRAFAGEAVLTVPFKDRSGAVYQTAFAPLIGYRDSEGTERDVVAVFGVDLSLAFLEVFNDFRQLTVLLSLIAILLTVIVGVVFARSLSEPIGALVRSAERMERGEMAEPVAVETHDEIGYLGDALENMRKGIVRRDRHLRTMLAGVAHEIRNPLGGIEIFAGLLRDDLPVEDHRRSHLEKIIREVQHLKTIINEFLIYARPRRPIIEPFSLSELLDDVSFLLTAEAEARDVEVSIGLVDDGVSVHADVEQIKRAILNLVKNAIQASSEGGKVEVRGHQVEGKVRITVKDYGFGIEPEQVKRIFDPFFTTKGSGAGLGLSIVRSIIEENDGDIWVESVPHERTIFFISLPASGTGGGRFRAIETPAALGR